MNTVNLSNNPENILNCAVKDDQGLNDFQKIPDQEAIAINKVGIERFRLPIIIKHSDGALRTHDAHASMFVYLASGKTGVNMSRFCQIIQEETSKALDSHLIKNILLRFRDELRDYDSEPFIPHAYLEFSFEFPLKQKSLKSDNWGWQYYPVKFKARMDEEGAVKIEKSVTYEYSATCPCSLSMSKQYERNYAAGKTTEGNGMAIAHSQRSVATCSFFFDAKHNFKTEELVEFIRQAIPTETQSLVKRIDEQAFAILNGEHPMFVEHASRRLAYVFDQIPNLIDWKVKVEHLESLHSHNAVAYISKDKSK